MTFKAAKCPSCGGTLQVPDDRLTVKCMYCGVDVIVRDAIRLAGRRVKEFTTAKPIKKSPAPPGCFFLLGGLGLFFASMGLSESNWGGVLFFGFFGLVLIMVGVVFKSSPVVSEFSGKCPYCDSPITISAYARGADCTACKKRIVLQDQKFCSVDTPVSPPSKI